MKLHYAGIPGEGFGWGVCNRNMILALKDRVELCDPDAAEVVFMPLANHQFDPISTARGKINLAYTFFEYPLGPNAAANAAKYDIVFAGSTWCIDRMKERGITNTELLIQGVDHEIFYPLPGRKPDGQFRIFSGGKFEYRKGQDLVIAAFKEFAKAHPEAHLVCSWFNPWPQLFHSMNESEHIKYLAGSLLVGKFDTQEEYFESVLEKNGLRPDQFTILPQLSQRDLAREMRNTDCGLFPNRCEGGTNLVLMEYSACGRPVVANLATGHADVEEGIDFEIPFVEDGEHWAKQDVRGIARSMEAAYHALDSASYEAAAHKYAPSWKWSTAADIIMGALTELKQTANLTT